METVNKDLEHLKILSICYYISAALTALFSCIPFIHLFMGVMFVSGAFPNDNGNEPPAFIGWFFIGLASIFILSGWAIAVGTFLAGKYMKQNKNWLFCVIMGALNCMFFPIGTTLGVFTFVVLLRESVQSLFKGRAATSSFGSNAPDWR